MKKKDVTKGLLKADELISVPDQIEMQGGSRVQLHDYVNEKKRADTLSDVIGKIKAKGGTVAKMVNNPVTKTGLKALPLIGTALNAHDVLASEDVGLGSDEVDPFTMSEDYRQDSPEEQLDESQLSPEEVQRWQKIKSLMER